jgi:hypothetical protein
MLDGSLFALKYLPTNEESRSSGRQGNKKRPLSTSPTKSGAPVLPPLKMLWSCYFGPVPPVMALTQHDICRSELRSRQNAHPFALPPPWTGVSALQLLEGGRDGPAPAPPSGDDFRSPSRWPTRSPQGFQNGIAGQILRQAEPGKESLRFAVHPSRIQACGQRLALKIET